MNNEVDFKRDVEGGIKTIESYDPTALALEHYRNSQTFKEVIAANKNGMKENLERVESSLPDSTYLFLTLGYYIGYAAAINDAKNTIKGGG